MPERIPKSVAKNVVFRAISSTDHYTPATSKTIAITIRKWAGSFANPAAGATNATEIASGFYHFSLGTGDTDTAGPLAWRGAGTGIDDVGDVYEVVNATNAGFSALPDVASGSAGAVIVSGTGTAALSVSSGLVTLAGVTHTGAVIPTVTTTTTATNLTNERGKYMLGCVWIGSVANTNTTNYIDGIMTNPVSTVAAAKTIADSLGLKRFWVQAGTTATLAADMAGYVFEGRNWTLATSGSRAFTGSGAIGAMSVTGTYTSAGAQPYWLDCEFGATASVPPSNFHGCEFGGTTTLNAAGSYDFIDCASVVAGTSTPIFAIPAGTVNVSFRRWSGGISITGITSGTTISIDVVSGGTVTLAGADGNVQVRGMCAGITDNRTGTPTLGNNAVINHTLIATPTNITAGTITTVSGNVNGSVASVTGSVGSVTAEVTANMTKISGSTAAADNLEESTEAIGFGVVDGTGATATAFLTSALTPDAAVADQFKGRVLIFKSDTTTAALRGQATTISSHTYTSAEVITLTVAALTTAPSTGDTFAIL